MFLIAVQQLSAQLLSPFNKRELTDTSADYSFIVSGHFHGASDNISTFPAATVLAGIDTLNALKPVMLISLGDMFIDVNETYIEHYRKSLFSKLQMPIFNAVGNHDLSNGNMYEKIYGKTFFSFFYRSEAFIVLNTELNDGNIEGDQLAFFKDALAQAEKNNTRNIFIFSHRPVWSENDPAYEKLFEGNTRTYPGHNNYEEVIQPLLQKLTANRAVYWMSGSMAGGPVSFFYHKEPETGVTMIQTAIRDLPRDGVLQVNVTKGVVSLKGISLTGQTLEPVENYNIEYWLKNVPEEDAFSYRMLPYLTMQMLKHRYFWIGGAVFFFNLQSDH
jgi:calcineurin-like phosphoesterase family protein